MRVKVRGESPRLYGLIGEDIGYTLSPTIHNLFYRIFGVNAAYVAWDVPRDSIREFIEWLRIVSNGFNVTKPYKELVAELCSVKSEHVAATGSTNTVLVEEGRLICENTDVDGVLVCLESVTRGLESALVIGAGGGARAVIAALAKLGFRTVFVANRSAERAQKAVKAASAVGLDASYVGWPPPREYIVKAELIVNATPLGTLGAGEPPLDWSVVDASKVFFDLVYNPVETPLLRKARARGARVVDGLCMLIWQALFAEKMWTGIEPSREVYEYLRREVLKRLARM